MFDPVSTEPLRAVSDQLGNLNPRTYNTISPIAEAEALTDGTYTLNSVPRVLELNGRTIYHDAKALRNRQVPNH